MEIMITDTKIKILLDSRYILEDGELYHHSNGLYEFVNENIHLTNKIPEQLSGVITLEGIAELKRYPKYEVIADYPMSPFSVGHIILFNSRLNNGFCYHAYSVIEPLHLDEESIKLYPAIFKRIK